jgi:hypothetical protein
VKSNNNQCLCDNQAFHNQNNDCYLLIIENKFKSLPDNSQLLRYNKKIQKEFIVKNRVNPRKFEALWNEWHDHSDSDDIDESNEPVANKNKGSTCNCVQILKKEFIIIPSDIKSTSTKTSIFVPDSPWVLITYEDLKNKINTKIPAISSAMSSSTILPSVVAYVNMTAKVIDVIKCAVVDIYTNPFSNLDAVMVLSKPLRINDLIEKWRYDVLRYEWLKELKKLLTLEESEPELDNGNNYLGTYSFCPQQDIDIYYYADFSRTSGLTGLCLHPRGKNYYFGLQVQANQLKLYVYFKPSNGKSNKNLDEIKASKMLCAIATELKKHRIFLDFKGNSHVNPQNANSISCGWNNGLLSYYEKSTFRFFSATSKQKSDAWFFYVQSPIWGGKCLANHPWINSNVHDLGKELAQLVPLITSCDLLQNLDTIFSQEP